MEDEQKILKEILFLNRDTLTEFHKSNFKKHVFLMNIFIPKNVSPFAITNPTRVSVEKNR